jgi:hypothetical protein
VKLLPEEGTCHAGERLELGLSHLDTSVSNRRKLGEDSSCLRRESLVGSEAAPSPDRPISYPWAQKNTQ